MAEKKILWSFVFSVVLAAGVVVATLLHFLPGFGSQETSRDSMGSATLVERQEDPLEHLAVKREPTQRATVDPPTSPAVAQGTPSTQSIESSIENFLKGETVTLQMQQVPLSQVLVLLKFTDSGGIVIDKEVTALIDIAVENASRSQLFRQLIKEYGLEEEYSNGTSYIRKQTDYRGISEATLRRELARMGARLDAGVSVRFDGYYVPSKDCIDSSVVRFCPDGTQLQLYGESQNLRRDSIQSIALTYSIHEGIIFSKNEIYEQAFGVPDDKGILMGEFLVSENSQICRLEFHPSPLSVEEACNIRLGEAVEREPDRWIAASTVDAVLKKGCSVAGNPEQHALLRETPDGLEQLKGCVPTALTHLDNAFQQGNWTYVSFRFHFDCILNGQLEKRELRVKMVKQDGFWFLQSVKPGRRFAAVMEPCEGSE